MPDPKLLIVMDEIKAVLEKHDVAALVLLSSPTHVEFLHKLQTSWTCILEEPDGIRFRCKAADYPDKATQEVILKNSVGTIASFIDIARSRANILEVLLAGIGKTIRFEHMTKEEPPRI